MFTTNCSLDLIDHAFKRPGRLDLVLHFKAPDAEMRGQLVNRWHEDIRKNLDLADVIASTDGYSFAEVEELKNLLIMHFMDSADWNWRSAPRDRRDPQQVCRRRRESVASGRSRCVGSVVPG